MNLSIDRDRFRKNRQPIDAPAGEDCAWITRDREYHWHPLNPRKPDIIELGGISPLLAILGDHRSTRNAKTICEVGFLRVPCGIFSRHGDLISNLAQIGQRQS